MGTGTYIRELMALKAAGGGYTGNYTPSFSEVQSVINPIIAANSSISPTITTFGSIGGSYQYYGMNVGIDGHIYCAPYNSGNILEINTDDDTLSTFGSVVQAAYGGGILGKDGFIYFIPQNSNYLGKIDTVNKTHTNYGSPIYGYGHFIGGSLAMGNANLYMPADAYDFNISYIPSAGSWFNIGTKVRSAGGVLAPNGKIYCAPYNQASMLVLDPSTDTQYTIPTGLAIGAWVRLFENCYKGIDEMLEKANEFDIPDNPKITVL